MQNSEEASPGIIQDGRGQLVKMLIDAREGLVSVFAYQLLDNVEIYK